MNITERSRLAEPLATDPQNLTANKHISLPPAAGIHKGYRKPLPHLWREWPELTKSRGTSAAVTRPSYLPTFIPSRLPPYFCSSSQRARSRLPYRPGDFSSARYSLIACCLPAGGLIGASQVVSGGVSPGAAGHGIKGPLAEIIDCRGVIPLLEGNQPQPKAGILLAQSQASRIVSERSAAIIFARWVAPLVAPPAFLEHGFPGLEDVGGGRAGSAPVIVGRPGELVERGCPSWSVNCPFKCSTARYKGDVGNA